MNRYVLVFDVGVTTGVVLCGFDPTHDEILGAWDIPYEDPQRDAICEEIINACNDVTLSYIILENPQNDPRFTQSDLWVVTSFIDGWSRYVKEQHPKGKFCLHMRVKAAAWKSHRHLVKPVPDRSKHINDAYGIAQWFFRYGPGHNDFDAPPLDI